MSESSPQATMLYHAFPRHVSRRRARERQTAWRRDLHDAVGLEILRSILLEGILLTPEVLEIPANPRANDSRVYRQTQTRACFTTCTVNELNVPSEDSHAAHFGEFAIGLDALDGREIGIVPTIYFYRQATGEERTDNPVRQESGYSHQLLYRLLEIGELLKVLAYVEADSDWKRRMTTDQLRSAGITLDQRPDIRSACERLHKANRLSELHTMLFATERVPIWNLIDAIKIILDLFQTVDSRDSGLVLAHFRQREWRLLNVNPSLESVTDLDVMPLTHSLDGPVARCLSSIDRILRHTPFQVERSDAFFRAAWIGRKFADRRFSSFIRQVIVPERVRDEAIRILALVSPAPDLILC